MQVEIDTGKSIEQNAERYYEEGKRAKRKLAGVEKAIGQTRQRLHALKEPKQGKSEKPQKKKKLYWYERFHWFFTSDHFLVVGGRDAKSNEVVVKKHLQRDDIYLHADIIGGASTVIKADGRKISAVALQEAAQFAAVFSKAWQQKLAGVDVYAVGADQVSKKAPSGESLGRGAFMIYGKRQWFRKTALRYAIGIKKEDSNYQLIAGPPAAIKDLAAAYAEIKQGSTNSASGAKQLLRLFESKLNARPGISIDSIVAVLPAGGVEL